MSLTDDFLNAWKRGNSKDKNKKQTAPLRGGDDFTRAFLKASKDAEREPFTGGDRFTKDFLNAAANGMGSGTDDGETGVLTDIGPVAEESDKEQKWYEGWFKKGDDNVGKSILGTLTDFGEDLVTGAVGIGEKAVDAFAYISPYLTKVQYNNADAPILDLKTQKMVDDMVTEQKEASAEFIQKDLYDEDKVAKQILGNLYGAANNAYKTQNGMQLTKEDIALQRENTQFAVDYMDNEMESDSVLGEKSDALVQSAGQLAGQFGLQAVGVPWFVTSGVTSFGSEVENAFNQGASYKEAGGSALISAGAEILTEKLFGGDLFVKGAGADLATKYLSWAISNKTLRTLMKLGIDAAGEGFEEVASEFISNLGSALYKEKNLGEILFSEEALDGYIESFIGGGVLGGGMGGINAVQSNRKRVDYVTELTKNEQAVVDKVFEDEVAKAEKNKGKKLTAKEKTKIYNEVLESMEKGYISTDTIEEILGDRTAYDSISKESEEFKTLYETESGKLSEKQKDRLAELKAKNQENSYEGLVKAERDNLSKSVFDMVKNDRLSESYAERGRRGETFQADVSQYDAKQRATVQAAIDSGVLNNTNRSHELVDFVAKISADKGVAFDFTNNQKLKETGFALDGVTVNGYVNNSGVTVNVNSVKALNNVVGHEITHVLEGTELYDALAQSITEYAKGKGDYDARLENLTKLYEGKEGYTGEDAAAKIEQEVVADLVGDYLFTDKDFVQRLSTENRNVFQKIFGEIKYLCRVVTAGSKEAKQLEQVKKAFEEAYRAETKNPTEDGGVKYSLSSIVGASGKNYGVGVHLDSTLLSNLTEAERIDMVKEYVKELGGSVFTAYDNNGNAVDIHIVESSKKFKNKSGKRVPVNKDLTYRLKNEVKQEAIALVDELVQASTYYGKEPATHPHDWVDDNGANDWDLWKTYMQDKQNTVWEASLRIANSANGDKILYDIFPIKMVEGAGTAATTTTNNNIAPTTPNVNGKNSLSNSTQSDDLGPLPWQIKSKDVALEAPLEDIGPVAENVATEEALPDDLGPVVHSEEETTDRELGPAADDTAEERGEVKPETERAIVRINNRLAREKAVLAEEFKQRKAELQEQTKDKNSYISQKASELYNEIRNLKKGVRASEQLGYLLDSGYDWSSIRSALVNIKHTPGERVNVNSAIESMARQMLNESYEDSLYELNDLDSEYARQVEQMETVAEKQRSEAQRAQQRTTRKDLHKGIVDSVKTHFAERGFDFDAVLKKAKNLSTFATVDNTPQRVMEKALGYKEGGVLADLTVNKVAQNETEGIKWLNSFTDRKNGLLAQISKQYRIKPGSKESAAAQMYAEGFYVGENNEIIAYGDAELAKDFPDAQVQRNIKGLARDSRIRQIYDDTLAAINATRTRNAYPEIPRLDNYFLHFRAMEDTFSKLGLPFNPNDIRAKDLPADLNGVTADLKPGQPYFASAKHRTGKRTSFDLLGGLERYLTSAKNQIYHIDDIQTLRALRNYVADTYGQANGLEGLDALSEEEQQERIEKVFGSHLSTFAKFLNEEANILAGKTALIDRGFEGIFGRRGITFLNTVNGQVGSNMVGFNISSSLTNFLPVVQTFAKTNKADFVKALGQTVYSKISGRSDGFGENSPVVIRRKGADRFHRTIWQKIGDPGYALMGAVDDISTELIARTKYNELTRKGMDSQQAHYETDKWVSKLMGDRSLGQQPQLYNSKMLGLITKFQLEVRNQLDSQFYDTIQEAKASNEDIQNGLLRNAKTAAKVTSTFVQLAVAQHLFGKAFESVAGYNPAFDIIEVMIKALGWDDDEESEDTALDNIEQSFFALLEDLPYTSTFTGGRIPIQSALPIEQLIMGEDEYGNEKSRLETLGEIAPYYLLPGGYGQIKKTAQGLGMFDDDLPIAGSYTESGKLRFPVDDTFGNKVQAGIFGQWANANAQDYFDNERDALNEKQIQEFMDTGMTIQQYWDYREGLSGLSTLAEKADYINGLDLTDAQKNILINNIADRKENIDMSDYGEYGDFEEFDFALKNPEKYKFLNDIGVSYEQYASADEGAKAAYNWAFKNPEKYEVAKAVCDDVVEYRKYTSELDDITSDKDENGKSIAGSRKKKVVDYINNLDLEYGEKIILYLTEYNNKESRDTYGYELIDYLYGREDISAEEMETIVKELGFHVDAEGYITWD